MPRLQRRKALRRGRVHPASAFESDCVDHEAERTGGMAAAWIVGMQPRETRAPVLHHAEQASCAHVDSRQVLRHECQAAAAERRIEYLISTVERGLTAN